MTKRICETCRFAKAAGFDNMGWCTHPKLQLGGDAKVFVRLHSLHCRNGWANDLWQPIEAREYRNAEPGLAEPLAPITVDEISAVLGATERQAPPIDPMVAASRGEDVVVGESTVLSTDAGFGVRRLSMKRAHEEIRARKREPRPLVAPAFDEGLGDSGALVPRGPEAAGEAVAEMNHRPHPTPNIDSQTALGSAALELPATKRASLPSRPIVGDVSPVELGEIGRPFPKMTHFPDDDARFSTVPKQVPGFELPFAGKVEKKREVKRAGFDSDDFDFPSWGQEDESPRVAAETDVPHRSLPVERAQSRQERMENEPTLIESPRKARTSSEPAALIDSAFPALPDFFANQDVTIAPPYRPERVERRQSEHVVAVAEQQDTETPSRSTERVTPDRPQRSERPARHDRDPVDIVAPEARPRRQSDRAADMVALDEDAAPIAAGEDGLAELRWSDVPRMCRSCRDFRPAESGERGWCTNKRAFSHRRMVDADDLPCETSIGAWWLPHDDLWLSALDVSAHSLPTPLFDAWIAARVARIEGYEDEAPLRRRKRS